MLNTYIHIWNTHKRPNKPPILLFGSGVKLQVHPEDGSELHAITNGWQLTDCLSTNGESWTSVSWVIDSIMVSNHPRLCFYQRHPSTLRQWAQVWSFIKDPWLVLGDICLDVSNVSMIIHDSLNSYMNLIQKEQLKLIETCLEKQGHLKATSSNIMDVLGRLTSKLHITWHTSYICSFITHKHMQQHMRHIGDLVIESLCRPLAFDFKCT